MVQKYRRWAWENLGTDMSQHQRKNLKNSQAGHGKYLTSFCGPRRIELMRMVAADIADRYEHLGETTKDYFPASMADLIKTGDEKQELPATEENRQKMRLKSRDRRDYGRGAGAEGNGQNCA